MRLLLVAPLLLLVACADARAVQPTPSPTPPQKEDTMALDGEAQSALAAVLLTADDLGPVWQTYAEFAGQPFETPPEAPPVSIDPGLEEPDARCGAARLIGLPDGVKVAVATDTLISTNEDGGGFVSTSAAVFPAASNAVARFDAYADVMRRCREMVAIGIDDSNAPPGLEAQIEVEAIDVPAGAFGLRIRAGIGGLDVLSHTQTEVIVRRGRVVAGFSFQSFAGSNKLDAAALAAIVAGRLEAAEATLPPSRGELPMFMADAIAQRAATAALTGEDDYPRAWGAVPAPATAESEDGWRSISTSGGSMFILSDTPACAAHRLKAAPGMLARAGVDLMKVGHDHYVWQYVAVFESDEAAGEAAAQVIAANRRCAEENAAARSPDTDIAWTAVELDVEDLRDGDQVSAGIDRWHIAEHDGFPEKDVISTDASALIRRGRMLMTLTFSGEGEDIAAAEEAVRIAIRKFEAAERSLEDQ